MPSPVQLARYDNSWYKIGGSLLKRSLWFLLGQPLLRCSVMPFSGVRVKLLRLFGARIGAGVVIKPSVTVKYPWHLIIGDHCWIGEQVWIDNLTLVQLESNVCVSQGAYLCTGNHDWADPHFGLIVKPIHLASGSWVGAQSFLAPGVSLGCAAVAAARSVIVGSIPDAEIFGGNPGKFIKKRVIRDERGPVETDQPVTRDEKVV